MIKRIQIKHLLSFTLIFTATTITPMKKVKEIFNLENQENAQQEKIDAIKIYNVSSDLVKKLAKKNGTSIATDNSKKRDVALIGIGKISAILMSEIGKAINGDSCEGRDDNFKTVYLIDIKSGEKIGKIETGETTIEENNQVVPKYLLNHKKINNTPIETLNELDMTLEEYKQESEEILKDELKFVSPTTRLTEHNKSLYLIKHGHGMWIVPGCAGGFMQLGTIRNNLLTNQFEEKRDDLPEMEPHSAFIYNKQEEESPGKYEIDTYKEEKDKIIHDSYILKVAGESRNFHITIKHKNVLNQDVKIKVPEEISSYNIKISASKHKRSNYILVYESPNNPSVRVCSWDQFGNMTTHKQKNKNIYLYAIKTGEKIAEIAFSEKHLEKVLFSRNNRFIVLLSEDCIAIYDLRKRKATVKKKHNGFINGILLCNNDKNLLLITDTTVLDYPMPADNKHERLAFLQRKGHLLEIMNLWNKTK